MPKNLFNEQEINKNDVENKEVNHYQTSKINGKNDDESEEVLQIQEKIGRVENESLLSTRRALRVLGETEELGTKTAAELVAQGVKLNHADETLDSVNIKLNATRKNIIQLKGFFGGIKSRFSKKKECSTKTNTFKEQQSKQTPKQQNFSTTFNSPNTIIINEPSLSKPKFATITGSDREAEMNKNLDLMSNGLARLKNLSLDIGKETDRQNSLIGNLNVRTDETNEKVNSQNAEMIKILRF